MKSKWGIFLSLGIFSLLLLLVLFVVILQRGIFQEQTPGRSNAASEAIQVSGGNRSYNPAVFVDKSNHSHVIWGEIVTNDIWEVKYTNNSSGSFKTPVTLSGKDYRFGQIFGDPTNSDHIVILFEGYRTKYNDGCAGGRGGGCRDVYFMESTNKGESWTEALQLPHSNDFVQRYNIVGTITPSGDLVVLYTADSGKKLVWNKKPANGSWGSEQAIFGGAAFYQFPAIASDDGGVYATITGGNDGPSSSLYFTKFNGSSWSTPRIIDSDDRPYYSSIALANNSLFVVDSDQRGNKVGSLVSSNNGESFQSESLTNDSSNRYFNSQIAFGGDENFYVVWSEGLNVSSKLVLKSGIALQNLVPVSMTDAPGANAPSLAVGPGVLSVAYHVNGQDDVFVFSKNIISANPTSTVTPFPTGTDAEKCQGNVNAPAKCFDCKKDSEADQINILDFACFSRFFGKQIGN